MSASGQAPRPDFFIVGAPKCGTSSLHQYLRRHPDAFLPEQKDVPYFGSDLEHTFPNAPADLADYLALFQDAGTARRIGDSCTLYMQSRRAAEEIAAWRPDASIIVMLRDPVDLMFSLHSHNIWMTEEDILDFQSALAAEPQRRRGERIPARAAYPAGLWYTDVAALGDQLERYMACFPPEQIHVILMDDLRRDVNGVVGETLQFLGLSTDVDLDVDRVVNRRRAPRSLRLQALLQDPPAGLERAFRALTPSRLHGRVLPFLNRFNETPQTRQSLSPELRARLAKELRPQVEKLEALLGRDLSGWRAEPPGLAA
ncbi:MAG TPA: sulfotransferase [Solirubrobacteraceae bacterium]|nr:sulfotransferase [Solirubrobacteraceae bacterium]